MKNFRIILFIGALFMFSVACNDDIDIDLGEKPVANFNQEFVSSNEVVFTNTSSGAFIYKWDFGNGESALDQDVITHQQYYPFKGEYEVTLLVNGKAGLNELTENVIIEETDPSICNDEIRTFLTGGCDDENGEKTWIWSTEARANIMFVPAWNMELYATAENEFDPEIYDDEFTFTLQGEYLVKSDNKTLYNWPILEPGHTPDEGVIDIQNPEIQLWSHVEEDGKNYIILGNSYIGRYEIVSRYEIVELTADKMVLSKEESIFLPTQGWSANGVRIMTFYPKN